MAESQNHEGLSASGTSVGSPESTIQLNVKTLDSQIYSFHVDKNIVVSSFKENIASQSGVPAGQQRLIFRGKVLKDDHPLSEYNLENGDTLHLVTRQLQPTNGSSTGEATSTNANGPTGGPENAGNLGNNIGSVTDIILGILDVDIVETSHGNESEGLRVNADAQSQDRDQSGQAFRSQSASDAMNILLGAGNAIPTLSMPIPHSMNTLIEFMNRMELEFSQNGDQQNQSSTASVDPPITELPLNSHGLPTVEALSIVLRQAQHLLCDHAVVALSNTADSIDQERGSNDPIVRGRVQMEVIQLGVAMQPLGALILELGRTMLTLQMGESHAESSVNAGPAVYIFPSGPNPIVAEPCRLLQTISLLGDSSGITQNQVARGPVGVGSAPSIIHTGSRAPVGGMLGERSNATAVSLPPAVTSISSVAPPSTGVSRDLDSDSDSTSSPPDEIFEVPEPR